MIGELQARRDIQGSPSGGQSRLTSGDMDGVGVNPSAQGVRACQAGRPQQRARYTPKRESLEEAHGRCLMNVKVEACGGEERDFILRPHYGITCRRSIVKSSA